MGDANAKVGRDNVGREDVMGKEGLGTETKRESCSLTYALKMSQ